MELPALDRLLTPYRHAAAAKNNVGNIPTEYPSYFEVNLNFNKYAPQWFLK